MNNQILSLMGLARRAGRVSLGNDPSIEALRRGQTKLILFAADISPRTASGVKNIAKEEEVLCITTSFSMDEISMAVGKRTGVVAVNDAGFAKKIKSLCTDE